VNAVPIGARSVGPGQPCFVIAEAGSNHDGDLGIALELIDIAAEAGADAVKFQVFRASRLYPRSAGVSVYLKEATPIYDIIARMEMPEAWLPLLAARCIERGVEFMASVFDEGSADMVAPFVNVSKIASYEMTHLPLVRHVARQGKPLIVSTGTATLDEIRPTLKAIAESGNPGVVLMQCTAAYPAPLDTINVRAVTTLSNTFDVPAGLSDHSRDPIAAPMAAVACGASVIEKHFTISNSRPGPDHRFALEPPELREMIRRIRQVEVVLGSGEKRVEPVENELRAFARRTIFATRPIAPGESLSPANIAVLRCGQHAAGFAPEDYGALLGRTAKRPIADATVVHAADLDA
jgi:sialic acid synthase SpsE